MAYSRAETCRYIHDTIAQLILLANEHDLEVVSFTLAMAYLEAAEQLAAALKLVEPKTAAYELMRNYGLETESLVALRDKVG